MEREIIRVEPFDTNLIWGARGTGERGVVSGLPGLPRPGGLACLFGAWVRAIGGRLKE